MALSFSLIKQGNYDQVEAINQEIRALGDTPGLANSLLSLGMLGWLRGNFAKAGSLIEQGLAVAREKGDRLSLAVGLIYMGRVASSQGEYTRACTLFEEGLALFRKLGNISDFALAVCWLAQVLFVSQSDLVLVTSLIEESLALAQELYNRGTRAFALRIAGQVALSQGDADKARALAEESLTLLREMGEQLYVEEALCFLASVEARQGDHAAAHAHYVESLALFRVTGNRLAIAPGLEGLASVAAAQGEFPWAARLWGAAEALREVIGAPLPPVYRPDYERALATVRTRIGEKVFAAMRAEGRTMTPEQALANKLKPQMIPTMATPPAQGLVPSLAGLTTREMDVLRLIAQGLTSAQVAERLVISVVTVNFHVRSIYSKLGVSSRSAVTRYAVEHHLV